MRLPAIRTDLPPIDRGIERGDAPILWVTRPDCSQRLAESLKRAPEMTRSVPALEPWTDNLGRGSRST